MEPLTSLRPPCRLLLLLLSGLAPPAAAQDSGAGDPVQAIRALAPRLAGDSQDSVAARRDLGFLAARLSDPKDAVTRSRAAQALLDLVADGGALPVPVRCEILRHLGLVAADGPSINRVFRLFDDPDLAESAQFALERIGNPLVDQTLIARLQADTDASRPVAAVARILGARRSAEAVEALIHAATLGEPESAGAARAALARIGDPRAEQVLAGALARNAPGSEDDLLVFLEARTAAARAALERAATTYASLLLSRCAATRVAAVEALAATRDPAHIPSLLDRLEDPDPTVRDAAERALVRTAGDQWEQLVMVRVQEKDHPWSPSLFRVAFRTGIRVGSGFSMLADELRDPESRARATALELMGELEGNEAERTLVGCLRDPADDVRAAAANSLVRLGERRIAAGAVQDGLKLIQQGLGAATAPRLVRSALARIRENPDASALEALARIASEPGFREEVVRARLAIARSLQEQDPDRAAEVYRLVVDGSRSRASRKDAFHALKDLGKDLSGVAARSGFVTSWRLLGPCEACDVKTLATHPFGDRDPAAVAEVEIAGRQRAWQPVLTDDPDGVVGLSDLRPHENCSVFALCTLDWPEDQDVVLKIGSDDGVAAWVDGALVHEKFVARGLTVDQDEAKARFRKGRNSVLLRISQGGGDWEFCLRVCDAEGRPIDLSGRNATR